MLDPDEVADYETWKAHKLTAQLDLSVSAYNTEMESVALAWEAGAKAAHKNSDDLTSILATNPNRKKGMRGYRGDAEVPAPGPERPGAVIPIETDGRYDPD